MADRKYTEIHSNPATVPLSGIPVLEYPRFMDFTELLMGEEGTHCLAYFVVPLDESFLFICCMAADENHTMVLYAHEQPLHPLPSLPSITAKHFQFHAFEREIHEKYGIGFEGHPWLKPVRYPVEPADRTSVPETYPFWHTESGQIHEVGVGPVHAGIIEPGHFRFTCHGEKVIHLEIQLGYQHRGVEDLFIRKQGILPQSLLAESIAGDTATGHALAYAGVAESLGGISVPQWLAIERTIALEMERIAMHIGDTAALCTDIGYQFGQVVNEALRTAVINTTQMWCGNRFGKGLIRPGGTRYPLIKDLPAVILKNLESVEKRYLAITDRIFSLSSALGRFEGTGRLTTMQATLVGAVGMAARSSGMYRDIRWSHPFAAYTMYTYEPAILPGGDVWSRAMLRRLEVVKSMKVVRELIKERTSSNGQPTGKKMDAGQSPVVEDIWPDTPPSYAFPLAPSTLAISLTEGWRGEICHVAVTGKDGKIIRYKVKDPSFHNWMALAVAVRNQEISDFPLCNKSFNLSYCGHDL